VSGVLAVILSAAKDLFVQRASPFAALRASPERSEGVTGILSTCLQLQQCSKKLGRQ